MTAHNPQVNVFELRTFRAIDKPEFAQDFFLGHHEELKKLGLTDMNFARKEWLMDSDVYIMALFSAQKMVGGSRIHLYHPEKHFPVEEAVLENVPDKIQALAKYRDAYQAEWCGLWLSTKFKGLGLAEMMNRTAIAFAHFLGLDVLFGICPRHTMDLFRTAGFRFMTLNDELIHFAYPTEDYVSYVIECEVKDMTFTFKNEQKQIREILEDPKMQKSCSGFLGESIVRLTGFPTVDHLQRPTDREYSKDTVKHLLTEKKVLTERYPKAS